MEPSSFTGPCKRTKTPGNVTQAAYCLVDGCNEDLSLCRDYHRRHKVCEFHSKTTKVTISGQEQRFCQQCSRFHSLTEFDEGKRSCRKRLDDHNRRRRKPRPDSVSRNSRVIFSTSQGMDSAKLLSFRSTETLPSASSWAAGIVKAENDMMLYNNQQRMSYIETHPMFPDSTTSSHYNRTSLQFPRAAAGDCEPFLDSHSASGSSCSSSQKTFSDGLMYHQAVKSERALSLLSSTPSLSRKFDLKHLEQLEPLSTHTPSLLYNLHFSGLNQYTFNQESENAVSVKDACRLDDASAFISSANFRQQPEEPSASGSHRTLTLTREQL